MIECLIHGIGNHNKYSENVRKFSMRQQYYSTAAYKSLRLFFNNHLPAIRTLQLWYTVVDGSPGICNSALEIIREKSAAYLATNGHKLHLAMMYDDIHIRKGLYYDNEKQVFVGFSTYNSTSKKKEANETESDAKLAKEALTYMVVGSDFKLPVAYELCSGLDSVDRAALTLKAIKEIEAAGAIIFSLTGDGLKGNKVAAEKLGANFKSDRPYFQSPTYPQQRIYVIYDPPHMLKLIRKHFSSNKIYHHDELINWSLLEKLVERQSTNNFNLCNKLTQLHINWKQKPMNVKLAAETISKSVSDTLEQLRRDDYDEFHNCEATVNFLMYFNDAFDILNFGAGSKSDDQYKQPLNENTANRIFEFAKRFKQYITELKFRTETGNLVPILGSSVEMGFLGFYFNVISLRGIYDDFILNGPLKQLHAFQFSQDHLETFFSLIRYDIFFLKHTSQKKCYFLLIFRNQLGRNDNPNVIQFASAFKKLLIVHPVMTSRDHNVITNATGILTISSKNPKKPLASAAQNQLETLEIELELSYEAVMMAEIESMDPYESHMCAYISLCIEEKFIQNTNQHRHKCSECAYVLITASDKINDELLAMKTTIAEKITQPSASTLKITIFCNAILKMIYVENQQGNNFNAVSKVIIENIDVNDLFEDFDLKHPDQDESNGHKVEFITLLIKTYMTMKSQKIGKKISDEERGTLIRFRKKRAVIVKGQ